MHDLTRDEARNRKSTVTVESYDIELDLTVSSDKVFDSRTRINFAASRPGAQTFLEVRPETVYSATLNGMPLPPEDNGRILLPDLAAQNNLVVEARMSYSREGQGLHRYVDPVDDQIYLYCNASVDSAPAVFACFDQPDLKAPFDISVVAPEDWSVLGTGVRTSAVGGRSTLATTPPLATYLTALVAGPYRSLYREHDGIRLGIHCRQSLARALAVHADEIFEITAQCLDPYHEFFGIRYPFGKYDQVFVPEFGILAMEGPACVLIRDQFLFESAPSSGDRENRAVVIAHEMSHMWFGNLVTMSWWDDLWLNESFADYLAHRVTSRATRFSGALTTFSAARAGLAYAADQRPTSHRVAGAAPDIATALTRFDRISYFKGSAVLRQLATRIGDEALRTGLRKFFDRHAYGNATLEDFLAALRDGDCDLTRWAELWLRSTNVTTLGLELHSAEGMITDAVMHQSTPDDRTLPRPHSLRIGLYGGSAGGSAEVIDVDVDGARTPLPQLTGRPSPTFVPVNDGDLTYAKVRLDPSILAALPTALPLLSPLNRAMMWGSLTLGIRDGSVPAELHLGLVLDMLRYETEMPVFTEALHQVRNEVVDRFMPLRERPVALARLAAGLQTLLSGLDDADERALVGWRSLISCTADEAELHRWLEGRHVPAGLELDRDMAWHLRLRLACLGGLSAEEIDIAAAADRSMTGQHHALRCRAALPTPAAKETAWTAIWADGSLSHVARWALAEGFWQPEQVQLMAGWVPRFFSDIVELAQRRDASVIESLARSLYPRYAASPQTVALAQELLERPDVPLPVRMAVIDMTDDLERAITACRRAETEEIR